MLASLLRATRGASELFSSPLGTAAARLLGRECCPTRLSSTATTPTAGVQGQRDPDEEEANLYVELPSGRVRLAREMGWAMPPDSAEERMSIYRTIDVAGRPVSGAVIPHTLQEDLAVKIYRNMAALQVRG